MVGFTGFLLGKNFVTNLFERNWNSLIVPELYTSTKLILNGGQVAPEPSQVAPDAITFNLCSWNRPPLNLIFAVEIYNGTHIMKKRSINTILIGSLKFSFSVSHLLLNLLHIQICNCSLWILNEPANFWSIVNLVKIKFMENDIHTEPKFMRWFRCFENCIHKILCMNFGVYVSVQNSVIMLSTYNWI